MLTAKLQNTIPSSVQFTLDLGNDQAIQVGTMVDHELVRSGKTRPFLRDQLIERTTIFLNAHDATPELIAELVRVAAEQFDGVMGVLETPAA